MKRTVRWVGFALLVVAMLVMGGCSTCDLKTEDLAGNWKYDLFIDACSGAGCGAVPIGYSGSGTVAIDANGNVPAWNYVVEGDCDGNVTGSGNNGGIGWIIEGTGDENTMTWIIIWDVPGQGIVTWRSEMNRI